MLQFGPLFPAEASTKMPEASVFCTIVWSVFAAQPSLAGHVQLLLMTCGRFVGSAFWPLRFVGAMNHWKHSV